MSKLDFILWAITSIAWYMFFKMLFGYFENARLILADIYDLVIKIGKIKERLEVDRERNVADIDYYKEEVNKFSGDKRNEIVEILNDRIKSAIRLDNRIFELNKRIIHLDNLVFRNRLVRFYHIKVMKEIMKRMKMMGMKDETNS